MSGKKLAVGGLAVVAVAMVAWPVYAHCGKCASSCKEMVTAMETGKTTLAKAIGAAESSSKGKAVAAVCELEGSTLEFDVFCMVGDKLMQVEVDGTGKAGEMTEAKEVPQAHAHGAEGK